MSKKEFENIDQLFKQELNLSNVKAPASVKANIDAQLGSGKKKWWLFVVIPILAAALISIPFIGEIGSENENGGDNIAADNTSDNPNDNGDQGNENPNNDANESNLTVDSDQNDQNDSNTNKSSSDDHNSSSTIQFDNDILDDIDNSSNNNSNDQDNSRKDRQDDTNDDVNNTNNDTRDNSNSNNNTTANRLSSEDISDNNFTNNDTSEDTSSDNSNSDSSNENNTNSDNENESHEETANNRNDNAENTDSNNDRISIDNSENNTSNSESESLNESTIDSKPEDLVDEIDSTANDEAQIIDSTSTEIEPEQDSLQTDDIAESDSTSSEEKEPEIEIQKPDKEKFNHWFLTLHSGPKFKRTNITAGDTSVVYDNALRDKIGFGVGMDVNYMLKNGLLFGSGIEYASYTESYDYQKIQTILVDSTVTWNVFITDSIVDSVGTTYIYDSTANVSYNYDDQEIFNQQGRNQTTYLHIPFRFGLQRMGKKWGFDAYVQGRFNLLLRTNAAYVLNDQIVASTLTDSYFDLELGGAVHYNIWKNLYLSGVVRYRPPLRNPYYDPSFQNKMQYLYVGFGASINF